MNPPFFSFKEMIGVDVRLRFFFAPFFDKGLKAWPRLVADLVERNALLLDAQRVEIFEDEVKGGEPLLPIDQLHAPLLIRLH